MSFVDGQGIQICMEIERALFELLNQFELDDLSHLNEVDRHYEQSELSEESLNHRALDKSYSVEEAAIQSLQNERLYKAIAELPKTQRKRLILYYFNHFTYQQIADLEGCAYQTIQKSVEKAEKKIKKFLM